MNKNILKIYLLYSLFLILSVGCNKQETNNAIPTGVVNTNGQKSSENFTLEEKNLGLKLLKCSDQWSNEINQFEKLNLEEETTIKAVAMGTVGKNCLEIKNVPALKIILKTYEQNLENSEINWNQLSKTVLAMESL